MVPNPEQIRAAAARLEGNTEHPDALNADVARWLRIVADGAGSGSYADRLVWMVMLPDDPTAQPEDKLLHVLRAALVNYGHTVPGDAQMRVLSYLHDRVEDNVRAARRRPVVG